VWATGYQLDFSILDIPVLDEWNYPRHSRGVTEHPGLYAVGLPWLTGQASALVGGVGRDAEYIAGQIAG
jgi:putative flavoprotein involved in K+ transport